MKISALVEGKGRRWNAIQTESFVFRYPHCTLTAHMEISLTGILKCIMLLFSSKHSKGSHDIQGKSHRSRRSSILELISCRVHLPHATPLTLVPSQQLPSQALPTVCVRGLCISRTHTHTHTHTGKAGSLSHAPLDLYSVTFSVGHS